jgi:hypothetical protein
MLLPLLVDLATLPFPSWLTTLPGLEARFLAPLPAEEGLLAVEGMGDGGVDFCCLELRDRGLSVKGDGSLKSSSSWSKFE